MADHSNEGISGLQQELTALRGEVATLRAELQKSVPAAVSPLAPKDGFPVMPVVDGVEFAALEVGVRYSGRTDVMLAKIAAGSVLAGVFTKSSTRAAPVLDCQDKLAALAQDGAGKDGFAILVNSGNANAFTGAMGVKAVKTATNAVATALGLPVSHVFSASTGVIGEPLPAEKIARSIDQLKQQLSPTKIAEAARAIMTTDTFAKGASETVLIDGEPVIIAGFAKGSGMIAPDMATMLVFIFTDAQVDGPVLQGMVSSLNKSTFNSITVDSDTSTSDTLIVAATGKSGIAIGSARSNEGRSFAAALGRVMRSLAHQVVRDGEGATKFLEVEVTGATSKAAAHKIAMSIANSPLVKTAVAGEDPNWGRVVMAIGKSGAPADRDLISIRFGDILVADRGWVSPDYREEDGAAYMKGEDLKISVDLALGKGRAAVWTCDFTKQYITINADYRS